MKKIKEIKDVKYIRFSKNNVAISDGIKVLLYHNDKSSIIDVSSSDIKLFNDTLVCEKNDSLLIFDVKNGSLINNINGYYCLHYSFLVNEYLYITTKDDYSVININTLETKKLPIKEMPSILQNDIGYDRFGEYLYAFNINSGDFLWKIQFDTKTKGDFMIYKNILCVPLSNEHLLGINADTGEKLWEIENAHLFYNQDKETGLLYGIGNNYYKVIDPNIGKIIVDKKFDDTYDGKYLSMNPYGSICGNRLYFINHISGNRFGAINLNTHEIEFVQDMKAKGRINSIAYCNGKLYITDLGNTLHIFEE